MLFTYACIQWSSYNFRFRLACFFLHFVFYISVKVKLTVLLLCVCVHSALKDCPQNDLYCVGWDVKPYHSLTQVCKMLFIFVRFDIFIARCPGGPFFHRTQCIFNHHCYFITT